MALFKSQVLTQASGSVGGVTYTRTGSGMVLRARSMPVNPRTALQTQIRSIMSALATRWSTVLTEEQRTLWAQYAANVAMKNRLGDSFHLSGNAMYLRCNSARVNAGLVAVDAAPSIFNTGEAMQDARMEQGALTPFSVSFKWTGISTPGTAIIQVSSPQNPSINFFKGPYRVNQTGLSVSGSEFLIPNPSWVEGQKLFARARITYDDGRLAPAVECSFVLTETPVVAPEGLAAESKGSAKKKAA